MPLRASQAGWAAAALLLITFLAYAPALRAGYVWDDDVHVAGSRVLHESDALRKIWLQPGATPQYYPLVHTSFWIERAMFGSRPLVHHVTNVLLHGLAALLFWALLRRLQVPGAWLAAALFALHPVQVESVAWITERKNVLALVFYLAAALAYVRFAERGRGYAVVLVLFGCALLSKTVTATLPLALLLVTWWRRGRIQWRDVRQVLPLAAMGLALGLVTVWMEIHVVGAHGADWILSWPQRIVMAGSVPWFYLWKLAWPVGLCFNYPRWAIDPSRPVQWLPLALLVVDVVLLWRWRERIGRAPLATLALFLVALLPALGIFNVYPFRYALVADHFQYLATLPPLALAAAALVSVHPRASVAGGVVLAILGVLTWRQSTHYRDDPTLWRATLAVNPESWIANNNLGVHLSHQGEPARAEPYFRRAIVLAPSYPEGHANLSDSLVRLGRAGEAEVAAEKAVELDAAFGPGRRALGEALFAQGRLEDALTQLQAAVELQPQDASARSVLGATLFQLGRREEGMQGLAAAMDLDPRNPWVHANLAIALFQSGRREAAIEHFRKAAALAPADVALQRNLAAALAAP